MSLIDLLNDGILELVGDSHVDYAKELTDSLNRDGAYKVQLTKMNRRLWINIVLPKIVWAKPSAYRTIELTDGHLIELSETSDFRN